MQRLAIFVHWDKDHLIDDYIIDYLAGIQEVSQEIVFISNSLPSENEINKIEDYTSSIIIREQKACDFQVWGQYLESQSPKNLNKYDEIILINDSCYGPLSPLSEVFNKMESESNDIWGISGSINYNNSKDYIHRYFMVLKKQVFTSQVFQNFFNDLESFFQNQPFSKELNHLLEIQFTTILFEAGFKYNTFITKTFDLDLITPPENESQLSKSFNYLYGWDSLIEKGSPFISSKVFTDILPKLLLDYHKTDNNIARYQKIKQFLNNSENYFHLKKIVTHLERTIHPSLFALIENPCLDGSIKSLHTLCDNHLLKDLFPFLNWQKLGIDHVFIYLHLAKKYFETKNYEWAIETSKKIRFLNNHVQMWFIKGLAESKLNKNNEALHSFSHALSLSPNNQDIIQNINNTKQQLSITPIQPIILTLSNNVDDAFQLISKGDFFDIEWYTNTYSDQIKNQDPIDFFCKQGWRIGHQPNPNFHTQFYSIRYLNSSSQINPLIHYIIEGRSRELHCKPIQYPAADFQSFDFKTYKPKQKIGIFLHLYFADLKNYFLEKLLGIPQEYDLFITCQEKDLSDIKSFFERVGNHKKLTIKTAYNATLGFDIAPFILEWKSYFADYDVACKLHSKKGNHTKNTNAWGNIISENLIGSPEVIKTILNNFQNDSKLGLQYSKWPNSIREYQAAWGGSWNDDNWKIAKKICSELNINSSIQHHFEFPAGSMFWFRPNSLKTLTDYSGWTYESFEGEYKRDGSIAHVIERIFGLVCQHEGYHLRSLDFQNAISFQKANRSCYSDIELTERVVQEQKLLSQSPYFQPKWYLWNNPDVAQAGFDPLSHFCKYGWKENRNPASWFDFSYFNKVNQFSNTTINPIIQHLSSGPKKSSTKSQPHDLSITKSRICLFAGYDQNGRIEPYVIRYIKELSTYCEVYYLADCEMPETELDKLQPYVKKAIAHRHGKYDFGSYSTLANQFIGWDLISQYEELLFVNDSCYCIKSLEAVFKKMDNTTCDFWGIQATQGMGMTKATTPCSPENFSLREPIENINDISVQLEDEPFYDLHIGSYFLAFRTKVINDPDFQLAVSSVKKESNKANIVINYEIGWTQLLLKKGYKASTFLPYIYPFHPLFTEWYFESLNEGMPLLKRFFLTQNHYYIPDLYKWEEKVLQFCSDECAWEIKENLKRIIHPDALNYLHHIKVKQEYSILKPSTPPKTLNASKVHSEDYLNFQIQKLKLRYT